MSIKVAKSAQGSEKSTRHRALAAVQMDGWQVLERINQDEAIEKIPTYIISAQDPGNEPPSSRVLLATIGGGIGLDRLLRCAMDISANLVKPESELGPTPL